MNGQWGIQNDPYYGDVINAYNDGPVEDGSVMGPFMKLKLPLQVQNWHPMSH